MITEKKIYNTKIGSLVADSARSRNKNQLHVIYNYPNRWGVVRNGSVRPIKSFSRLNSAISYANKMVSSVRDGKVIIHDHNGNVSSRRLRVNAVKD